MTFLYVLGGYVAVTYAIGTGFYYFGGGKEDATGMGQLYYLASPITVPLICYLYLK